MEEEKGLAERIQMFMKAKEMGPGLLADRIGVQRSGISHILSGRNKPSYDFIRKFLAAFPEVNAEWFITGVGNMLKEPLQKGLFGEEASPSGQEPEIEPSGPENPPQEEEKDAEGPEVHDEDETPYMVRKRPVEGRISRVILLYEDGHFHSYTPDRQP